MLLINRSAPDELNALFSRVNEEQMADWLEKHGWDRAVAQELKPNQLLYQYIKSIFTDLEREVNDSLHDSGIQGIHWNGVIVIYSGINETWSRGYPDLNQIISERLKTFISSVEQSYFKTILQPWPDLVRKFDKNVF
jgi:hypothetical protein